MNFLKHKQKNLNPFLFLVGIASVVSCGDFKPYQEGSKKCKFNCNASEENSADRSKPRNTEKVPTSFSLWDEKFRPTQLTPEILNDILQTNAPSIALSALNVPFSLAQEAQRFADNSQVPFENCIVQNVKQATMQKTENLVSFNLDYGKCFSFEELEKDSSEQSKAGSPTKKYEIFERVVEFSSSENNSFAGLNTPETIINIFKFLQKKSSNETDNSKLDSNFLDTYLTTVAQTKYFLQKDSSRSASRNLFSAVSLGEKNSGQFFRASNESGQFSFNGKMNVLFDSFEGSNNDKNTENKNEELKNRVSYKLKYQFENLKFSNSGLTGILFLRLNNSQDWLYAFENSCLGRVFLVGNTSSASAFPPVVETVNDANMKYAGTVNFCSK
jgi:hypothetical protein